MKPLRIFAVGLAVLLGFLLAAAAVAFNWRVQTWALRRALASRPGLHATLGLASASLTSVRIRDLRLSRNGAVLMVPSAEADLPVLEAIFGRKVLIRRLVAVGWTLDLSRARGGVAALVRPAGPRRRFPAAGLLPAARADGAGAVDAVDGGSVFEGLLARLRLPVDGSLDEARLEGDIVLAPPYGRPAAPDLGRAPVRVHVSLRGGGLAAGREGRFALAVRAERAGHHASAIAADGTVAAAMDTPRTFSRLSVRVDASARVGKLPEPVKLAADFTTMRTAAGEDATLGVDGDGKRLALVQAHFPSAARRLTGTWLIDLGDADLVPFSLGGRLPRFSVSGSGRFDTDPAWTRVAASGRLNAAGDRLGALGPAFAAVGPVRVTADFGLDLRGADIRVDRLAASVAGAQPIAEVNALQPFEFDAASGVLKVADPATPLLGIVLSGVPLGWAQPLLPSGWTLSAASLDGSFFAQAGGGGLALRPRAPLVVDGVTLARGGEPVAEGLDLRLSVSADYTPGGWQVEVGQASVSKGGALVAEGEAQFGRLAGPGEDIKAEGRLKAALPALARQPLFAPVRGWIERGSMTGDFAASFAGPLVGLWSARRSVQIDADLRDLALSPQPGWDTPGGARFDQVTAAIRADFDGSGRCVFRAPLAWRRAGRRYDLALSGTGSEAVPASGSRDRPAWAFDVRAAGSRMELEDAELLGSALVQSSAEARGVSAKVAFSLSRLDGAALAVRDCSGIASIAPGRLDLEDWRAGVGPSGSVAVDGRLETGPGQAAFQGKLVATDFDAGAFCNAFYPGRPPALDGRVDVTAGLQADAGGLRDLPERLRGTVQLTSKGGIFRALRADVAGSLQRPPSLLSEFMGAFSSLLPGKGERSPEAQRRLDKQGSTVVEIADLLREVRYDQLAATAERGADGTIRVTQFALIAPELRIAGLGRIGWVGQERLADQEVSLDLRLGARGHTADLMNQVGLLGTQTDDLGYTRCPDQVHLAGTVSRLDDSQWRSLLVKAAARKTAGRLGLLGKIF